MKDKFELLAGEIMRRLDRFKVSQDVTIYANGKRWAHSSNTHGEWTMTEGIDPTKYTEWANKETLCMTFEGPLYHIINGGNRPAVWRSLNTLFKERGYWAAQGYAWDLSLYPRGDMT